MMTIKQPTFKQGATTTELFYRALCVESEHQAQAYMRGLTNYFRNTYPQYYADKSNRGLELAVWREIKRYAIRNRHPFIGLYRLYGIPRKDA